MKPQYSLEHISNRDLLTSTKDLVGASNQMTSYVLAHLAEVEARGIHREVACSSIQAYCVYELRMSEDEAQRRIIAARTARRFPVIFEMVETAALHLTGILLLAPHLTDENHAELLQRARFRTKSEIQRLIAQVAPKPDVPATIEPLGPPRGFGPATQRAFAEALRGPVRNLPSGNGPGDAPAPPLHVLTVKTAAETTGHSAAADPNTANGPVPARNAQESSESPSSLPTTSESTRKQRYKVQFTADQQYVDLLERARDLLQHELADRDIALVHRRAMEVLVEKLQKRRCGDTSTPRLRTKVDTPSKHPFKKQTSSRYIPVDVRRHVWGRDGAQCTFVDERGVRCRERARLEFHHCEPFFRGGSPTAANITLRCRSHNRFAAEQDLGRAYVAQRIEERRSLPK
jgi:hypothetical protein